MLALNPPPNTLERFLQEPDGNQYAQVARKWLQKLMERGVPGYRGLALQWGRKDVSHDARGILGYVEWYADGNVKINVPYPKTPYQLEVFLHELGHIWLAHDIKNACNGKTRNCRPENRQEYEAESWAMDVLRQEGIPISDDMFSDAQDYVTGVLFGDMKDGLPISRDAVKFIEINDRLKAHDGWADFLDDLEGAQMINPATRLRSRYMRNPAEASAEVYEEFHGAPSEHVTEISEEEHYHSHLAELGVLKGLKFRTVDGEKDITLDFDCDDCDQRGNPERRRLYELYDFTLKKVIKTAMMTMQEAQEANARLPSTNQFWGLAMKGRASNLFGFGGGGKKVSGSSRLMREAFEAGYNGTGGYRGTQEFKDWLEHAAGDQDLTRSFKKSLQREYMRGMKNWQKEGEVAAQLGKKRGKGSAAAARGTQFATAVARRNAWEDFTASGKFAKFIGYVGRQGSSTKAFIGGVRTAAQALARAQEYADKRQERVVVVFQTLGAGFKEQRVVGTVDPTGGLKPTWGELHGIQQYRNPSFEEHWEERGRQAATHGGTIENAWHRRVSRREKQELEDSGNFQRAATAFRNGWQKEFYGHNPRKGPLASAAEFTGSMAHGAAQGVDSFFTRNPDDGDGPVILCSNEDRNQLYLVGGDQSVDLFELKLDTRHDSMILGECWAVNYTTQKKFDDFAEIEYVHIFGPEDAQTEPRKNDDLWEDAIPPDDEVFGSGVLPTLRYDVLNQTLHLDGGSYFVTDKGIEE